MVICIIEQMHIRTICCCYQCSDELAGKINSSYVYAEVTLLSSALFSFSR